SPKIPASAIRRYASLVNCFRMRFADIESTVRILQTRCQVKLLISLETVFECRRKRGKDCPVFRDILRGQMVRKLSSVSTEGSSFVSVAGTTAALHFAAGASTPSLFTSAGGSRADTRMD